MHMAGAGRVFDLSGPCSFLGLLSGGICGIMEYLRS